MVKDTFDWDAKYVFHLPNFQSILLWLLKAQDDLKIPKRINNHQNIVVAARVLATYLIPGCVGRGVRLGSENSSGGAAAGGGAGGGVWAQAWAQVGGPTWGPSGWAHVGPTHEEIGGKFLKIFFTHEKLEAN